MVENFITVAISLDEELFNYNGISKKVIKWKYQAARCVCVCVGGDYETTSNEALDRL